MNVLPHRVDLVRGVVECRLTFMCISKRGTAHASHTQVYPRLRLNGFSLCIKAHLDARWFGNFAIRRQCIASMAYDCMIPFVSQFIFVMHQRLLSLARILFPRDLL